MMRRVLFTSAVALVLVTAPAPAQFRMVPARPVGPLGGGVAPLGPGVAAGPAIRVPPPVVFGGPRNGFRMVQGGRFPFAGAGFSSLYPYAANYGGYYGGGYYGGGFGGGFITGGYGGYGYSPYFVIPGPGAYDDLPPGPPPWGPAWGPPHVVQLSGQETATLTLEFPAEATVWLDGTEVAGEPATVRTLTSPVVGPGERYTFHVRARWTANGTTYETTRDVAVGPGDRTRLLVVSGTAVK